MKGLLVALALFIGHLPHSRGESTVGSRDLSNYDRGGVVNLKFGQQGWNAPPLSVVRSFVWRHWVQKRRGQITLSAFSDEGRSSVTTFYIEPTDSAHWRVVGEHKYEVVSTDGDVVEKTNRYEAITLARVKPKSSRNPGGPYKISTNKPLAATSFMLQLVDQDGQVINYL